MTARLLVLVSSWALLGAAPPPGLLFHASFDDGPRAEHAAGSPEPFLGSQHDPRPRLKEAQLVPGAFGRGVTNVAGSFHALGNVLAERGTIAFFARLAGPDRGDDPMQVRTVDWYYWRTYVRVARAGNSLAGWVPDEAFNIDVSARGPAGRVLTSDRWRHVALAWDQAYGVVLYLDGEPVASTWGARSWLSRGVDPAELFLSWHDGSVAYDELYVFDRPLTHVQVLDLMRSNRPPRTLAAVEFDARRRFNRMRELGWENLAGAPRLRVSASGPEPLVVRRVVPRDARAVLAEAGAVFDGKLGQGWPHLRGYHFNQNNGLAVELPESFDLLVVEGRFRGRVHRGRSLVEPTSPPLFSHPPDSYVTRWNVDGAAPGWLSFFWSGPERERQIAELSFFRTSAAQPTAPKRATWYLDRDASAADLAEIRMELEGRFGAGDRVRLGAVPDAPSPSRHSLGALRFHHVVLPARKEDWALRALGLTLFLRGDLDGTPLRIELRDPLQAGRRLMALDVVLRDERRAGSGRTDLVIDLDGQVVPAGRPLWMIVVLGRDLELDLGNRASRLELIEMALDSAVPGFVQRELPVVRTLFRKLSEERPWAHHEHPERDLARFNLEARELFAPLMVLHRLAASEPRVGALWLWTHKRQPRPEALAPTPVAGHAAAPAWALWQRELRARCREILQWWIDHRQAPSGEFGDDWNDDTDLIQNFPAIAHLSDPGGRLAASAKAVADGVYASGRLRDGLNVRLQDPLHAYEEGINAQQVMALMAPGDPTYLENLMESARAIDERLMVSYAPRRRALRSARFSADEVQTGPWAQDSVLHSILLAPALSVAYYNRNRRAIATAQEWVDGWLDHYPRTPPLGAPGPLYASARRPDGTVTERDWTPRGWGYVSLFPALYELTGDRRYRDVTRYWMPPFSGAFLEHVTSIHEALDLISAEDHRGELIRWSRSAQLAEASDEGLVDATRRRLFESEITGQPGPAIEALRAAVSHLRALHEAYTWAEPNADRIWLPSAALSAMAQGGVSHQRNQIWPQHHVSYAGFSDLAAWVREKSRTRLRLWLYSFAPAAEQGALRLWRVARGRYAVRIGIDEDGDGEPEGARSEPRELGRFSTLPLRLEPGKLVAVEIALRGEALEDPPRPDLALSLRGRQVVLHNIGGATARNAVIRVTSPAGGVLAERTVPEIEAPLDLRPRRAALSFPNLQTPGPWMFRVDPSDAIPEANETNNTLQVFPP